MRTIGRTIGDRQLRAAAAALLEAAGSAPAEAAIVADHLVGANLAGHDSHGVGMIPRYVENAAAGLLHPNRTGDIVTDGGSLLAIVIAPGRLVDAGWLATETVALLDYMRTARSHPGAPVLIPGEPEIAARASRSRDGIPIDDTTLGQLRTAGLSCGMTADRLDALGLAATA